MASPNGCRHRRRKSSWCLSSEALQSHLQGQCLISSLARSHSVPAGLAKAYADMQKAIGNEHRSRAWHRWRLIDACFTSCVRRTWEQIVARVRELLAEGFRVMLVLSALSQVTNRLEKCIKEAVAGEELLSLQFIEETHRRLAKEVGLDANWCRHTDISS